MPTPLTQRGELNLRDSLRILRRRRWLIIGCTILVGLAAYVASSLQTPRFRATASVLLQPRTTESIFDPSVIQNLASGKQAPTEMRVVLSDPVVALVPKALRGAASVSIANPSETDFILITATTSDRLLTAKVANAYADAYAEFRRRQAIGDLEKAASDLEDGIAQVDAALHSTSPDQIPPDLRGSGTEGLTSQREFYASRLQQLRLAMKQKTGGAQVQTPALAPTVPFSPHPRHDGLIGAAAGLVLSLVASFGIAFMDDRIQSKDDLDRLLGTLPVLGIVPTLPDDLPPDSVIALEDPRSTSAEAYRALRTSIQFMSVDRSIRAIQITSAAPAEGKSTTAVNLAVALAQAGENVIVIDCDLRHPRLHQLFDLSNDVGLTSVLIREAELEDAVVAHPEVPNLYILPSGPVPPNPSELLGGQRIAEILAEMSSLAKVIVDCPPVLPVTDAVVLSGRVDGTLLIVAQGKTRQRDLRRAREVLDQVAAPTLGVVFNGVAEVDGYGYSGRYRYQYRYSGGGDGAGNGVGRRATRKARVAPGTRKASRTDLTT